MLEPLKKTIMASLGMVAFTKEKLDRLIEELVERGELTREQGVTVLKHLLQCGDIEGRRLADKLYREFERLLGHGPLATRRDLKSLDERVKELESRSRMGAEEPVDQEGSP